MKRLLLIEIMAISFLATFYMVLNLQQFLDEELAKTTAENDVKFLDVKWGQNLVGDGTSKSIIVFLDVKHKVYIKIFVEDNDLCYQKHNPEIYGEGNWGCNEECNIGGCGKYELSMTSKPTIQFSTERDKIVTVCWLRTPNIDLGVIYPQYIKCETKVLNKPI